MIFPTVTAKENENKTQGNDVYYIPKEIDEIAKWQWRHRVAMETFIYKKTSFHTV